MSTIERATHRVVDEPMDRLTRAKADFRFLRMHVDVNASSGQIEIEIRKGMLARDLESAKRVAQGMR